MRVRSVSSHFPGNIRAINRGGFTIVELLVVIGLLAVLISIIVPAVQRVRESAGLVQCRNNLHNIGIACHNMQSNTGRFPAVGKLYDPGNWAYSCLFQLLPYCEQQSLHGSFDFNTHASSRENLEIINRNRVSLWHCPSDPFDYAQQTNYLGNSGTGVDSDLEQKYDGFLKLEEGARPADFSSGLSNTVAFTEVLGGDGGKGLLGMVVNLDPRITTGAEWKTFESRCAQLLQPRADARVSRSIGVVWTDAGMGASRYNHILTPGSNSCQSGGSRNLSIVSPNSYHADGVATLMADGSVRVTSFSIDSGVWKQLGSRKE